jgi:hypothetical protein
MGLLMSKLSLKVSNSREACSFLDVGVLARQILVIPGSQIESEHIFSIVEVFCNLWRCIAWLRKLECTSHDTKE